MDHTEIYQQCRDFLVTQPYFVLDVYQIIGSCYNLDIYTNDCNGLKLFQFCFKTTGYRLPETSPGLLRGKFFKLFSQLLSEKGDVIVVITVCLLPKAVFRM